MPESNPRGTDGVSLRTIPGFWIRIPNTTPPSLIEGAGNAWQFTALPEVQVTKEAQYSDVQILGRSSPVKTYTGSGYRRLAVTFHLYSTNPSRKVYNIAFIRALDSLLHPQYQGSYLPPPIAQFRHGVLVGSTDLVGAVMNGGDNGSYVNVICMSTSYTLDPNIVHLGSIDLFPQYISVQANFDVVYPFSELPGSSDVLRGAY